MADMTISEFLSARIAEEYEAAMAYVRWDASETDVKPDFDHIGSRFPDRVLAECAAKRRIVKEARDYSQLSEGDNGEWAFDVVVGYLASVYADHEDFQEAWRV